MQNAVLILLFIFSFVWSAEAQTSSFAPMNVDDVTICPASMSDETPPNFNGPNCRQAKAEDIDPQDTLIWVRTSVVLGETRGQNGEPLSIYVSGKFASELYLNGQYVGANGMPGERTSEETAGAMDAEFFPPQSLFRIGENEIVLRASSHHGYLKLYRPLHWIGIGPTGIQSSRVLSRLAVSLITLGLFVVGWLYFGAMAILSDQRIRFATLSAICFFAGGQLVSETLRGLVYYSYPVQDLRLLAITGFSIAFGFSVTFHILRTFLDKNLPLIMTVLITTFSTIVFMIKGFDYKALAGLTLPLAASLLATGYWAHQRRERAFVYFISLLIFLAALLIFQGLFLDTIFFLLVAFFILLLFVEQALTLASEARERRSEEARANRLEQALAEVEERADTSHISIKSAGRMERIATSDIVRLQGASGYSEIFLAGGQTLLHAAPLNEMEDLLPATFLRVHRSHLINIMFVKSLSRDPAGTGILKLSEGSEVPVSRRIMPKVRQALG